MGRETIFDVMRRRMKRAAGFAEDEQGSLLIFGMFMFILILMAGGMAVDLMRYEATRTAVQNTLDRAILAAANLDQKTEADTVVTDYFAKAGLEMYAPVTDEVRGDHSSWVQSSATAHVQTLFMKNIGIEVLPAVTEATAEERVSEIEISLVLDISNSMNDDNRLPDMKDAAENFVTTIFEDAEDDTVTVSIIPYNTQVNVGPDILGNYTVTHGHSYSHCVDFEAADFHTTQLSPSASASSPLKQTGHFDSLYVYQTRYDNKTPEFRPCDTRSTSRVLPFEDDQTVLINYIKALVASGNTSIDVGLKWAAAMIDPTFGPVVDDLIAKGRVEAEYADRPLPYTGSDAALKVIVVMTDGHNTSQFYLPDAYSSGPSLVWRNPSNNRLSIWRNRSDCTKNSSNTANKNNCWYRVHTDSYSNTPDGGSSAVNLGYQQLWNDYKTNYIAGRLADAGANGWSYNTWDNQFYKYVGSSTKDDRMEDICNAAKAKKVVIFSIGFEVSDDDAEKMEDCASSESHFFRVAGPELTTAFAEIANKISQLRLVD